MEKMQFPGDVAAGRPADPLQKALSTYMPQPFTSKTWDVDNFQIAAASGSDGRDCKLFVVATAEVPLVLNYGFADTSGRWGFAKAVALTKVNGLQSTELVVSGEDVKELFVFVLGAPGGKLFKNGQQDFELELPREGAKEQVRSAKEREADLIRAAKEREAAARAELQQQQEAKKADEQKRRAAEEEKRRAALQQQEEAKKAEALKEMIAAAAQAEQERRAAEEAALQQREEAKKADEQKRQAAEEEKRRAALQQQQEEAKKAQALKEREAAAAQAEQDRRAAEEAALQQQEKAKKADEQKRRAAEEEKHKVALQQQQQEEARKADEQKRRAAEEEKRRAALQQQEEAKKAEALKEREAAAKAEQQRRAAEEAALKQQEDAKKADEQKRQAAEEEKRRVALQQQEAKEAEPLKKALDAFMPKPFASKTWNVDNFQVAGVSGSDGNACKLKFATTAQAPLVLHYGIADASGRWTCAKEVAFTRLNGLQSTEVVIAGEEVVHPFFVFVLEAPNNKKFKDGNYDFELSLPQERAWVQALAKKQREAAAARAEQEEKHRAALQQQEEAKRAEEQKKRAAEEAALQQQEEAKRADEQKRRAAEDLKRRAALQQQEEAKRADEQKKRAAEEAALQQQEGVKKTDEQKRRAAEEEQRRVALQQQQQEEAKRADEQQRRGAEDLKRRATLQQQEEAKRADEQKKLAAEEEKRRTALQQDEAKKAAALKKALVACLAKPFASKTWTVENFNMAGVSGTSGNGMFCKLKFATTADVPLVLHYGFANAGGAKWHNAKEVAFKRVNDLQGAEVVIPGEEIVHALFMFVLKAPNNKWLKNGNEDFELALPQEPAWAQVRAAKEREAAFVRAEQERRAAAKAALQQQEKAKWAAKTVDEQKEEETRRAALRQQILKEPKMPESLKENMSDFVAKPFASEKWDVGSFKLAAASGSDGEFCKIFIVATAETPLVLNYGFADTSGRWNNAKAVALTKVDGLQSTEVVVPAEDVKEFFMFVLGASGGKMFRNGQHDFELALPRQGAWEQVQVTKEREADVAQAPKVLEASQAEQEKRAAEEASLQQQRRAAEEERRRAALQQQEETRKADEHKRRAAEEEKRRAALQQQEETKKVDEQKRRAAEEDERRAALQLQEEAKKADEQKRRAAEEERHRAALQQQEEVRKADERKRQAAEEEKRRAALQQQEEARKAEEQKRRAAEEEKRRAALLQQQAKKAEALKMAKPFASKTWQVDNFEVAGASGVDENAKSCVLKFCTTAEVPLTLHYGCAGTSRAWHDAKDVSFTRLNGLQCAEVVIAGEEVVHELFMFVLKAPNNQWFKNGRQDFELELPQEPGWKQIRDAMRAEQEKRAAILHQEEEAKRAKAAAEFQSSLKTLHSDRKIRSASADVVFATFEMMDSQGEVDVAARSIDSGTAVMVDFIACINPLFLQECQLHWGVLAGGRSKTWHMPSERYWPPNTIKFDAQACQTPFLAAGNNMHTLSICLPALPQGDDGSVVPEIPGMFFVIKNQDSTKWLKHFNGRYGCDCLLSFKQNIGWSGPWVHLVDKIIESECEWGHMTLMHRYNLCREQCEAWERGDKSGISEQAPSWDAMFRTASRTGSFCLLDEEKMRQEGEIRENNEDENFWSWIFVWQRFSYLRLLDWQRNYNTKPRELEGATNNLNGKLAQLWKSYPSCRLWVRWTIACLGRGGNKGQQIRDEILNIMHRNKIPETSGHFYEQWHQKLHNNTTPDDIGICKALIAFLRSNGDMGSYWGVLRDHGITAERLASYDRSITKEPYLHGNVGNLIFEFESYLKILQNVHDALDLQTAIESASWCLPPDVQHGLQEVCNMRQGGNNPIRRRSASFGDLQNAGLDECHRQFMRVSDVRSKVLATLNNPGVEVPAIKELLFLDFALETQQGVLIQGMGKESRLPQLCDQMLALLTSIIGHLPMEKELQIVMLDWMKLSGDAAALRYWNNARESALLLNALNERVSRVVGDCVDKFQSLIGPKAYYLGDHVNTPKQYLDVFVDEVLRSSALFSVSLVLKRLEPVIRGIAELPPWQLISSVDKPVQGELRLIDKVLHIQDKVFETPTILLSGAVSGEEEVPVGVQALLVRSAAEAPDILSHCAVRARNAGVLLAVCFDPDISAQIASDLEGQWVEVRCGAHGTLSVEKVQRPSAIDPELSRRHSRSLIQETLQSDSPTRSKQPKMNLTNDLKCAWCIRPDQMDANKVGSKSLNLALLRSKLNANQEVLIPQAVALPYGCMQKALTDKVNTSQFSALQKVLDKLQPNTCNEDAKNIFTEAKAIVESLSMPAAMGSAIVTAMEEVGTKDREKRLLNKFNKDEAWEATKKVWSSLFGLRPWVSLAKANRSFHDLNMAVLVQELVTVKYAFVLHTMNPFNHDKDDLYGEIVSGRGETLVGNYPGRAMSFSVRRAGEPIVNSFPSKSIYLKTQPCLIFRSDSNGEDLEGFAGAGLFESICAKPDKEGSPRYHQVALVCDRPYRQQLLKRIAQVGWAVETHFAGMPQDIEGCVDDQDRIFIVQSRPQV